MDCICGDCMTCEMRDFRKRSRDRRAERMVVAKLGKTLREVREAGLEKAIVRATVAHELRAA